MNPRCYILGVLLSLAPACGGGVSSDQQAQQAYLGLDASIDKAIQLGFDGFNAASSANIPAEMTTGMASGTLTVTGQVDQGTSANKGMRLSEAMNTYSDDGQIQYTTSANSLPALTMQLKNIPTGTLTGTLTGDFAMAGALSGSVTLNVTFNGNLQPGTGTQVERQPGTTQITGTATSGSGTYQINVTH